MKFLAALLGAAFFGLVGAQQIAGSTNLRQDDTFQGADLDDNADGPLTDSDYIQAAQPDSSALWFGSGGGVSDDAWDQGTYAGSINPTGGSTGNQTLAEGQNLNPTASQSEDQTLGLNSTGSQTGNQTIALGQKLSSTGSQTGNQTLVLGTVQVPWQNSSNSSALEPTESRGIELSAGNN